jgi:hypothetical protein
MTKVQEDEHDVFYFLDAKIIGVTTVKTAKRIIRFKDHQHVNSIELVSAGHGVLEVLSSLLSSLIRRRGQFDI